MKSNRQTTSGVGAALAIVCILAGPAASTQADDLAGALQSLIEDHEGDVTVAIKNLKTGESFEHGAGKPMPTASLIKFPLMVAAYQAMADGKLAAGQTITLKKEDKVPGSGILTEHFSPGAKISLQDAIHLMIVYSDNTATNLVIDQVGLKPVAELMEKLDCPETKLNSQVFRRDTSIFPDRSKKYGLGSTTAAEMVKLLEKLHAGELVDEQSSKKMLRHMYACDDKLKFRRYLPDAKIAHKSGSVNTTRCEAGLVDCENGPIALCVMTDKNEDQSWDEDNAAEILCGRIAQRAFRHFNPEGEAGAKPSGRLMLGDAGALVAALQRTLNVRMKPSPDLGVDGDFGPATQAAVVNFQRDNGIPADGEVKADTWKALGALVADDPKAPSPEAVNSQKLKTAPADALDGRPFVTCKAWAIADGKSGKVLWGQDEDKPLDFASTTKIMTCYLVVRYASEHPEALDEIITFSRRADNTEGSSAEIQAGEKLPVRELLYGMMLPSGNDATVAFAEHFGARLAPDEGKSSSMGSYDQFVDAMNAAAKELGMTHTTYKNMHGLTAPGHQASAADLAKLAHASMNMPLFRTLVRTRQRGYAVEGPDGYKRNVLWKNTNKLLDVEGYDGVKTGTTNAAGACLVSHGVRGDRQLFLVVLGATSSDGRYSDSRNLYRWAWNELAKESDK
jgi:serine-type D-Ala-D-Ala carboxypeptidase (penicillin-binding protein 5/6)